LALIAGYSFQFLYEAAWLSVRELAIVAFIAVAIGGYQTIDLNFFNYDNDDQYYVYVYAHTRRETLKLVDAIDVIAKRKQGGQTGITIVSPDYWPLPWYLRDYSRVGYFGRMADSSEPLIVASSSQVDEVRQKFGGSYRQVGSTFALRPGVDLVLFERR
jgi:predicted membrane-bound mannosyltransferase